MDKSLCAVVLASSLISCVSKTNYLCGKNIGYITVEKPCLSSEADVKIVPCQQDTTTETADQIMPEYRALLDTIAWAEGTNCHYNMMVGRMLFTDYSSHPIDTGEMPKPGIPFKIKGKTTYSTAAGRFQFLYRTYKALKEEGLFNTGFYPEEQEKAGIYLIEKQGIAPEHLYEAINSKSFIEVWNKLSWVWASIPCDESINPIKKRQKCYLRRGRYNQFTYPDKDLKKIFFIFYETYKK